MIRKLGYYLRRPGYYLSIALYDIPFTIFFSVLVLKLLLFDYINGLRTESFAADFGIILIITAFSLMIRNKIFKITYLFSFDIICSLIFFSNSLYRRYFEDFASVYHINQIPLLLDVADSVIQLIDKEYLFLIDFIFLPFLLIKLKNKCNWNLVERLKALSILLALGLYCNLTIISSMLAGTNFFDFIGERYIFVWDAGVLNYQLVDGYCYAVSNIRKSIVSQSEIDTANAWFKRMKEERFARNSFTGIGEGYDLIVIQVESLQNLVIGRLHDGREITENLNKIAREGLYFSNIYDQTAAGNSSDATLLANSSVYPARKGAASFLYAENCFDSLPKILGERGYMTAVLDPSKKSFWNSVEFDKSLGFHMQLYEGDFVQDDRIGLGLSDRSFLAQSIGKIGKMHVPYFAFLRTLTGHFPYSYVKEDIDHFPLGDIEGSLTGNYLRTVHYVDAAIGEFLRKLDVYNPAAKTVVVVYGDHRARLPDVELKKLGITDPKESKKIPLIIYLSGQKQGVKRDTIGGLIDLAPTLCNILNINISNRLFIGKDLGNGDRSFVVFRNGSYYSMDGSMNKTSAEEQLRVSDLILEKNMIRLIRNGQKFQ